MGPFRQARIERGHRKGSVPPSVLGGRSSGVQVEEARTGTATMTDLGPSPMEKAQLEPFPGLGEPSVPGGPELVNVAFTSSGAGASNLLLAVYSAVNSGGVGGSGTGSPGGFRGSRARVQIAGGNRP